jgi:hypothetical protein
MPPASRRPSIESMPRTDAGHSSRVEWIAIAIVVVVSAVVFALLLAAEAGVWTWVIVSTALLVVAAVAIGMLVSRHRHPSAFDAPRPTRSQAPADGVYRVLVVADESLANHVVAEEIVPRAGGGRLEAFVVAPELRSRLAHWTGDDSEHGQAERHLGETLSAFKAAGIPANGTVGSDDPVQAADDALRTFPADELVFVTGAEANWLEDDALDLARGRYGIPVTQIGA